MIRKFPREQVQQPVSTVYCVCVFTVMLKEHTSQHIICGIDATLGRLQIPQQSVSVNGRKWMLMHEPDVYHNSIFELLLGSNKYIKLLGNFVENNVTSLE